MASVQIYAYAAIVAAVAVLAAHRVALVTAAVLTNVLPLRVPASHKYRGNNGTVSGSTYCAGAWEGTGGNNNMVCVGGMNATTGAAVPCDAVAGLGTRLAYDCRPPNPGSSNYKYRGNNGTVSGSTYCAGAWEGTGGNKNMVCVGGMNAATGATVPCDAVAGLGTRLAYDCSLPNYPGNNGTVSGSTYCAGAWGSTAAKNMRCLGGVDADGNPIGCAAVAMRAGSFLCR